jgi:hypothetical protein
MVGWVASSLLCPALSGFLVPVLGTGALGNLIPSSLSATSAVGYRYPPAPRNELKQIEMLVCFPQPFDSGDVDKQLGGLEARQVTCAGCNEATSS